MVVLNVLMPIFSLLRQALVKQSIVMADETSYRVIESKKCETYYWMFCSGHLEAHPIVLYHHAESRGHEVPQEFLTGFCGYLQCDGWTAYPLLPDVTLVYCGAHIRRKFFEALSNKKDPPKNSPAYIGFDYWNQMFTVEKQMKHLSPEERVNQRKVKLKPLLDAFGEWLDQLPVLPKSKLGIAVEYAAKHFKSLYLLLEDGRLELSNNRSERMIKELVIGRKNWLHSATLEGATASGIILSIMKTAEENKLDVCKYFNYLFTEIPNLPVMDNASLEKFLPWSKDIQSLCK